MVQSRHASTIQFASGPPAGCFSTCGNSQKRRSIYPGAPGRLGWLRFCMAFLCNIRDKAMRVLESNSALCALDERQGGYSQLIQGHDTPHFDINQMLVCKHMSSMTLPERVGLQRRHAVPTIQSTVRRRL